MMEWIFISCVILISSIISYEDWKKSLIRNKLLLVLIFIIIAYNIVLFVIHRENYLLSSLWNIVFSISFGFILWELRFWSAGDSKMFIVLSLILLSFIPSTENPIWLDFLINTFVPLFIFYLFYTLLRSSKKDVKDAIKTSFNFYRIFVVICIFIGLSWFLTIPFSFFGLKQNLILSLIFLFVIIEVTERYFPFKLEIIFILFAILRLIIDFNNVFTLNFLLENLLIVFVFIFFRFFTLELSFKANTYSVKIPKLKIGMRPAEGIMKIKEKGRYKYKKMRLIQFSEYDLLKQRTEKFIINVGDEGLVENDIKLLNNLFKQNKLGFDSLLIHTTMPFAIFLLMGFIITSFFKSNLFITFKSMI